MSLKELFTCLYSLALDPLDRVFDSFDVLGNIWAPRLWRNLNDWKLDGVLGLLRLLEGIRLDPSLSDGWEWTISRKGSFPRGLFI